MTTEKAQEKETLSLPERPDIPEKYTWRLEDLFETAKDWEKALRTVESMGKDLASRKGSLKASADGLLEGLKLSEALEELMERVFVYAHLLSHQDTRNQKGQSMAARAVSLAVKTGELTSFIVPEIIEAGRERVKGFIAERKELERYRFLLEDIFRQSAHRLSTEEETLLSGAGEIAHAPESIFSMLTNADMSFPDVEDEKGQLHPLSQERYGTYLLSPDRTLRENSFMALHRMFGSYKNTLSGTLNATLRGAAYFARSRKYSSTLEAALAPDNIPLEVYHGLIKTVQEHLHLLHRYTSVKKRALALESIHMYDMYFPLAPEPGKNISYEDACRMVAESLRPLGDDYVSLLLEGFESRWVDVLENRGKRGGAYSWGSYGVHPYVLLNYNGTFRDVFTIAHEMGHALHKAFTDKKQPFVYSSHSIFTAEVASTTNEILLHRALQESVNSREEKLYFANALLEQIRTTFFRQTLFAEFELKVHGMIAEGEAPTAETFCSLWRSLNEKYYGNDLQIDTELEYEWARIPHFYSPFYVYQYATGYAAATAISRNITEGSRREVKRYLEFLESGKSDYPVKLLRQAGVDMTSSEPVKEVASLFEKTLKELERLLQENQEG